MEGRYGESPVEVYDDVEDSQKVLSLIRNSPSRLVDNLIMAQDPSVARTALIVAPLIYGQGAGPVNQRSIQVPEIARATLKYGQGFRLLRGLNQWSHIHIRDLGDLFLRLAQAAVKSQPGLWNGEGIYLPGSGAMEFGELNRCVASAAQEQGLLKSSEIELTIDVDEANKVTSHGGVLWGTNAVFRSGRAQHTLGWEPQAPGLVDSIAEAVASEAKRLQGQQ
ncbi:hypothetical protein H2204_008828 [Knufia peltigerae]|uniref:Uncharacterized protein n=1 Tax=Knufia peltigerae TaxID=1002370 RepID=A0AA38XZJ5_9EURO|nr:hypothetical protein H2204_008828 [Knufia peltigerae]